MMPTPGMRFSVFDAANAEVDDGFFLASPARLKDMA
jgi:hypothetical protein